MNITVLAENSVCTENTRNVEPEHGISLFIESDERRILFDTGQSDLFVHNAAKLGIDLSEVDYAVVSHGHFDHGGGLRHFLRINEKAKIYVHRLAFHPYYTRISGLIPYYIGLDQKILTRNADRIRLIDQDFLIEPGIQLLEGFPSTFPQPEANSTLFVKRGKQLVPDTFKHEMAMLLNEGDTRVLFTGCSHSGITNIIEKAMGFSKETEIKAVFGGFHIHNPISKKNESRDYIEKLIAGLQSADSVFYSGHCTGEDNFKLLQVSLGSRIRTMSTGEVILI